MPTSFIFTSERASRKIPFGSSKTGSLAIQSFRYPAMLSMVERGRLAPRDLITETIPLEKAFGVIEQMSKFENVGISVINQF